MRRCSLQSLYCSSNMTTLAFAVVGAMLNASMIFFRTLRGIFMISTRRTMFNVFILSTMYVLLPCNLGH